MFHDNRTTETNGVLTNASTLTWTGTGPIQSTTPGSGITNQSGAILDFAAGRRTYQDLRQRLLAGSPLLAGRLVWEHLRKNFVVQWPQAS